MVLSELITALIDIDLSDSAAGAMEVSVEEQDDGSFLIVVGAWRTAL